MTPSRPKIEKLKPKEEAAHFSSLSTDKNGFDVKYINAFKGRGVFSCCHFQKGDFLLEYRGDLINKKEHENRQRVYNDTLKVFMFEFRFNGKHLCIDAAREDGSLGRLVNDDHLNPNCKMKVITVAGKPHLCLFALKDISPGQEITYNYGDFHCPWRCEESVNKEPHPERLLSCGGDNAASKFTDAYKVSAKTDPSISDVTVASDLYTGSIDQVSAKTDPSISDVTVTSDLYTGSIDQKCQHALVSSVVPSLEKYAWGSGPFASLNWIGVKCKNKLDLTDVEQSEESEAEKDDHPTSPLSGNGVEAASQSVEEFEETDSATEEISQQIRVVEMDSQPVAEPLDTADDKTTRPKEDQHQSACPANVAERENPRRKQKQQWSPREVSAIMRHFKKHISDGKLASKIECQQCKTAEHPILAHRSLQNIRDFVRNRGVTLKKQKKA